MTPGRFDPLRSARESFQRSIAAANAVRANARAEETKRKHLAAFQEAETKKANALAARKLAEDQAARKKAAEDAARKKTEKENAARNAARELKFKQDDTKQRAAIATIVREQQEKNMPIPFVAIGGAIGIAKKIGPIAKKVGGFIGGLFKSKKRKRAEAAAKAKAQAAVYGKADVPAAASATVGLTQFTADGGAAEKKPIPLFVWVGGGLAVLVTILFLMFKRKR